MFSLVYHKSEGFIQKDIEATNGDNILKRVCLCLFFLGGDAVFIEMEAYLIFSCVTYEKYSSCKKNMASDLILVKREIWQEE